MMLYGVNEIIFMLFFQIFLNFLLIFIITKKPKIYWKKIFKMPIFKNNNY
jgi:hypothetical protein